jgi:pimeloyl-ACP methyl ester carboxylesterase
VHYTDFGGTGQSMALVQGLGGASLNWMLAAPQLARRNRVLAPDLVGFSLTTLGDRPPTMSVKVGVLHRFLERMGGQVVVLGNSMGGTVAMLEAAGHPDLVRALVLVRPALPYPIGARIDPKSALLAGPITAPGLARLMGRRQARSPERVVKFVLALVTADPARVASEAVEAHLDLTRQRARYGFHPGGALDRLRARPPPNDRPGDRRDQGPDAADQGRARSRRLAERGAQPGCPAAGLDLPRASRDRPRADARGS